MNVMKYFEWIAKVCELLGWAKEDGVKIVEDPNWFGCWDDGMTPEDAVAEAKTKGVV